MMPPTIHRPRPFDKPKPPLPQIDITPSDAVKPVIILRPVTDPGFVTPGGGQKPVVQPPDTTTEYQQTTNGQPQLPQRPEINPFDPSHFVATNSGRHPAHDLPSFEAPQGAAQCLFSGYGRRYWIDEKGKRHETGMPSSLRGFGPIMRDVPAFTHHSAGCVLLIYRREDWREKD
jgi:hypothetical protein